MPSYPTPQPGASLLLAFSPAAPSSSSSSPTSILLLGPSRLSALRAFSAIEAGYRVLVGAPASPSADAARPWDPELAHRFEQKQVEHLHWDLGADATQDEWSAWLTSAEQRRALEGVSMIVLSDTLTSISSSKPAARRSLASARAFRAEATRRRFLVNVADCPDLSDFGWMVSHRFDLAPPSGTSSSSDTTSLVPLQPGETRKSPLQLALTTNSSACRLATRLRRELIASLPKSAGAAVEAVGKLRDELKRQAREEGDGETAGAGEGTDGEDDSEETQGVGLNRPVEQLTREKSWALDGNAKCKGGEKCKPSGEGAKCGGGKCGSSWTSSSAQLTRMRYVSQLSEYWPLDRLATVDLSSLFAPSTPLPPLSPSRGASHLSALPTPPRKGRILLLGTGPGNPLLLTQIAHLLLTTTDPSSPYFVDTFLSDKLVPSQILDLIPSERRKGVVIARKYPGNAEAAQEELMELAIAAANEGKTVLRMKQGDPFLYGRGGEEVLRFRSVAGIESVVIPGLSSSLAGPALAGIPVTQRGVAESVVVCTGVGRGGRDVPLAPYERPKTLCVLMGVARLSSLVVSLMEHPTSPYPPYLPIALVERAGAPDQRVVLSTVEALAGVLETLPPHRPPGMIVVGWACMCLDGEGDLTVLPREGKPEDDTEMGKEDIIAMLRKSGDQEHADRQRVGKWLGSTGYKVREGLGEGWDGLLAGLRL
ncbi:hypothetical protein JCM8547_003615 [Rhodosporidiobolus lusitaniae]